MIKNDIINDKNKLWIRIILITISILMILSILPEIILTLFTYPLPGDDYGNALFSRQVWEETHQLSEVFKAAVIRTVNLYKTWQGSISGVFLMALNPVIFSIGFYRAIMLLINLIFIFAASFFSHTFFYKGLNIKRYITLFIASLILFVTYHLMPHPFESFYWFVGASFYFMTFAFLLIFFSLLSILNNNLESRAKTGFVMAGLALLALFFGLNNLPNAVMLFCALILMCFYSIYKKDKISKYLIIITVLFLVGLLINVAAPGNIRRGGVQGTNSTSFLGAILHSFLSGWKFLIKSTRMSPILGALMILTGVVYKSIKSEKIEFINPIIFGVVTFLIYISQFAPVLYAVGRMPMGRVDNIRFITAQFFVLINYLNLLGFIKHKDWKLMDSRILKAVLISLGSLLITLCVMTYIKYPSNIQKIFNEYQSGKINTFILEQDERIDILEDCSIKEVVFEPLTYPVIISGNEKVSEDVNSGSNISLAEFYNKTSIYVEKN
jgi:hypothetical protein